MTYTVGEMAARLKIAPSTLRYYDKEGLLPFVKRSSGGIRRFDESDVEWLQIIDCLKKTGMSIKEIRAFIGMVIAGDETIARRLQLFQKRRREVLEQIEVLQQTLDVVDFKCWYYETALAAGTTAALDTQPDEAFPPRFRKVRARLKTLPTD